MSGLAYLIMKEIGLVFVVFFLVLGIVPVSGAERPNILIIVADDLGFSDLGCYGGEIETPNLDRLAAGGIRLAQFYTMARCCPSRASILTGQYPHRVGLGHMTQDIGRPGYRGRLSENARTIAQVLEPAGYRSFISGKWHLGTEDPTEHGFEEFYGTLTSAKRFFDSDHMIRKPDGGEVISYGEDEFYATDAVTDHALQFLGQARETAARPWFLYLAYHAPHFPLHARSEDIAKYADRYHGGWDEIREERLERMKALGIVSETMELSPRSRYWNYGETKTGVNGAWDELPEARRLDLARRMAIYAAMVDVMDANIGRVLEDLREHDEYEDTFIVFLSDNGACAEWDPFGFDNQSSNDNVLYKGDALAEMGSAGTFHSVGSGWANASNTPWRLYKHFCHEGGIRSPCIVHWPSGLEDRTGSIFRHPTHIIDLMPTVVALAELEDTGELPLPGRDLLGYLGEDVVGDERELYFEHEGNRAIRAGKWKLVALRGEPWELYAMDGVRTEVDDVSAHFPEVVAALSRKWSVWAEENLVTPLPGDYEVDYLRKE
ncbi:MAG: arylsulfatase [Verrucomicrobiota bacterium]